MDVQYRWLEPNEVTKIGDIDRSERIRMGYVYAEGELQKMAVNWDSPSCPQGGDGEYSVAAQIRFCEGHLARNGRLYGAFSGEKLVGIGLIQHNIGEGKAQLAYLHVSNGYRQQGVAGQITKALIEEAKSVGAKQLYVSATPSGSAVGFYLSQGFRPTDTPVPELFALEPEDIHMIMTI
jgi:ribosomal protein S18 acetylase RimI-like enzyme